MSVTYNVGIHVAVGFGPYTIIREWPLLSGAGGSNRERSFMTRRAPIACVDELSCTTRSFRRGCIRVTFPNCTTVTLSLESEMPQLDVQFRTIVWGPAPPSRPSVESAKPFIMRDIRQFAPAGEKTVSWKSDSAWANTLTPATTPAWRFLPPCSMSYRKK
jgi:hypothetical protein